MNGADVERQALITRVTARFSSLRAAGVLSDGAPLSAIGLSRHTEPFLDTLARLARLLNAIRRLTNDVLPAAPRQPGRLFLRTHHVERQSIRGTINWPRTIRHRAGRESMTSTEFVCSMSRRSLVAPENILLVLTLNALLDRGRACVLRMRRLGVLEPRDRDTLSQFERRCREILDSPHYQPAREEVARLGRLDAQGHRALLSEVATRARLSPAAAPDWARSLLSASRDVCEIPSDVAAPHLESSDLWDAFARLETISALNAVVPVRMLRGIPGVASRDVRLFPSSDQLTWTLKRKDTSVAAVRFLIDPDWNSVRAKALLLMWDFRHEGSGIDNWMILHRSTDAVEDLVEARGALQLSFSRIRAESLTSESLIGFFASSLGRTPGGL